MSHGGEAAHVAADLGADDVGAQVADPGNGGQEQDRRAKGLDMGVDLPIDCTDGGVEGVDVLEVQLQQEAVVIGHPAAQRFAQRRGWGLDPAMSERGQGIGIALARDQSLDHRAARQPDNVRDHRVELDVGILQRLLQALDMAASLTNELLAGAQQAAQFLRLGVRHEAAADQAMGYQIGQPGGVVDIGLAPRHVLDVPGIGQHQGEIAVAQNVPNRLPVDAGRLHRDVRAPWLASHSDKARRSFVVVLNVRTSRLMVPFTM